jgi:hypothetical protein
VRQPLRLRATNKLSQPSVLLSMALKRRQQSVRPDGRGHCCGSLGPRLGGATSRLETKLGTLRPPPAVGTDATRPANCWGLCSPTAHALSRSGIELDLTALAPPSQTVGCVAELSAAPGFAHGARKHARRRRPSPRIGFATASSHHMWVSGAVAAFCVFCRRTHAIPRTTRRTRASI